MATRPSRPAPSNGLRIHARLVLPWGEIQVRSARSGGPGGQHVNKVASKVILRFSVARSRALGERRKHLLLGRLGSRLTAGGELIVQASRYRERSRNLDDAYGRLAEVLRAALAHQKRRVPTRPTRASRERRLGVKRRQGERKRERKRPEE